MLRLALFTPWPPQPTGVAGRAQAVATALAERGYGIDVFVDEREGAIPRRAPDGPSQAGQIRVQSAHDFVWRQARSQFDLTIYQLGNSRAHQFVWPYLFRWPGLVVLHDGRLHHARARALLLNRRLDDYRTEFAWNHPGVRPGAAELAVKGFDGPYYYQWPMLRSAMASARLLAAHSPQTVADLQAAGADPVAHIALGEGLDSLPTSAERDAFRASLGFDAGAVVIGLFGGLSREKRVPQLLRAFAAALPRTPQARLLLAGTRDPQVDIESMTSELGIAHATRTIDAPDDDVFGRAIASADISVHLRWPTSGETSGPWLRALSASRPTIVTDLESMATMATLDPRTWRPHAPAGPSTANAPIAVAIDIVDEDHSLRLALGRLADDETLREQIGRAGHAYWTREHTVGRMVDDYERAIAQARARPIPDAAMPTHMRPDAIAHARQIADGFDADLTWMEAR